MMTDVEKCVSGANSSRFKLVALASVLTLGLFSGAAIAQDTQRYSLEKTDSGIFRLDRQTGAVDLCSEQAGKVICAPTETLKSDGTRVDLLEKKITDLETRLSKLEKTGGTALPSEEEFEKGLSYMERFMRSFFGVAKSLDQTDPANPGRT